MSTDAQHFNFSQTIEPLDEVETVDFMKHLLRARRLDLVSGVYNGLLTPDEARRLIQDAQLLQMVEAR